MTSFARVGEPTLADYPCTSRHWLDPVKWSVQKNLFRFRMGCLSESMGCSTETTKTAQFVRSSKTGAKQHRDRMFQLTALQCQA